MENIAHSFLRTHLARIRKVGLTCLAASTLTTTVAVASAERHVAASSGVPVSEVTTAVVEAGQTSPTVAGGEAYTMDKRHDSRCPWGRLGDGHGLWVRCLTSDEAGQPLSGRFAWPAGLIVNGSVGAKEPSNQYSSGSHLEKGKMNGKRRS